ncbi:MAG: cache domain-containing protein [Acetobacteraceae bacterium]|nr:cache domain-containing protein [Acetobacteraceae bacterium]
MLDRHTRAQHWPARRVSLTARLLLAALLTITLAVVAVQAWTVRSMTMQAERTAAWDLDQKLIALEEMLRPFGTEWRAEGDRLLLGQTALNDRTDVVDAIARMGGVATIFRGDRRIATSVRRPDGTRGVGTTLAAGPARDASITRGEIYQGRNDILGRSYVTIYKPVRDAGGRQVGLIFVGTPAADVSAMVWEAVWEAALAGAVALLLVGGGYWLLLRHTLRPLDALRAAVEDIHAGRLDTTIPCRERADVLGSIGRGLDALCADSRRARALEAEAEAGRRAAKEQERNEALRIAGEIEASLGDAARQLAASSAALKTAADGIEGAAGRARHDTGAAADGARDASENVSNVAGASEQLAQSVNEISRRVGESTLVVGRAVDQVRTANGTIQGLTESAERIGDVVRLISDIAGQTNLLALNATIEAARAGEAGKGFAVVASEVKSLASQTAKATEEIATQINAMREAVEQSVRAVRGIGAVIEEVHGIGSSIAAAVEEQGAATREIARGVAEAAHGTQRVAGNVARASEAAASTLDAVEELRRVASDVSRQGDVMQDSLGTVLRTLRTE